MVCFCSVLLFNKIDYRSVKYWLRSAAAFAISWVAMVVVESVVYMIFGDPFTKQFVFPLYMIVYALVMSRYPWSVRVVYCAVFYAVMLNIIIISVVLGVFIFSAHTLFFDLFTVVFCIACVLFLHYFRIDRYDKPSFYFIVLLIISAVAILLAFVSEFVLLHEFFSYKYGIIINTCMIVVEIGMYYIFYHFIKAYDQSQYLLAMSLKQSTYVQMKEINEAQYLEMHKMRHDMKNQYAYIKELLRNKDYAGLEQYFSGLNSDFEEVVSVADSGNKVIDNIMNLAAAKARSRGVALETQIVCPHELPFNENHLIGLFLNLIDNAIEACERDGVSEKKINVSVRSQHDYLLIRVSNPFVTDLDSDSYLKLKTSKADAENHGFGTRIIRDIAAKYNGQVNYHIENGSFIVDVMLVDPAKSHN